MESIRLGMIGMGPRGRIAWIHTLKLFDQIEIVAVCDQIEPLRTEGAARAGLGEEQAYGNVEDLLARTDIDAVAICVETEHQADIAIKALNAGKHVICEVPLCYSVDDCWRIVRAVEQSGRKLAMAEQLSFAPFTRAWRQLLTDGDLGQPLYAEAQYIHGMHLDWYWIDSITGQRLTFDEARQNPNAQKTRFWNISHPSWYNPHSLGPLLRILEQRIVRVTGMATRRPSAYLPEVPLPDMEVALLQTDGDTILRITTGFVIPTPRPWLWYHLIGTNGEVETGRQTNEGSLTGEEGMIWLADRYMPTRTPIRWGFTDWQRGDSRAAASGHDGLDFYPIADFIESILDDRPPVVDVYRAAEIAAAGVLAGTSAEQGSVPLEVPDFRRGADRSGATSPTARLNRPLRS